MSGILLFTPSDLVDLFLNFQRLEVVKLWLVRLELGVKLVLAALFLLSECRKDTAIVFRMLFSYGAHCNKKQ
jgi:hypothetical protein